MKFSIRDLLWLTLLAGFAVTWWIDRSRLAAEVERLRPNDLLFDDTTVPVDDPFSGGIDTHDPFGASVSSDHGPQAKP
ncbi:MAG TPA: hypothetical protein VFB96_02745 [Pirellulaceae bacterium]|nr:hypothetical protein [Pirellulaceae bacterium]